MSSIDRELHVIDTDFEVVFLHATIRITYHIQPPSGDGWSEPREGRAVIFQFADRVDVTPHQCITDAPTLQWARKILAYEKDDLIADWVGMCRVGGDPDDVRDARIDDLFADRVA